MGWAQINEQEWKPKAIKWNEYEGKENNDFGRTKEQNIEK